MSEKYTVGLISDTHGSLPTAAVSALEGCKYIIHAGDIGSQQILWKLEAIAPVTAVLGNCDWNLGDLQLRRYESLCLAGASFFVTHRNTDAEEALRGRGFIAPGMPLPQICVHGHTHIPRNQKIGSVLLLCPGSPTNPRGGSKPSVMRIVLASDLGASKLASIELIEL